MIGAPFIPDDWLGLKWRPSTDGDHCPDERWQILPPRAYDAVVALGPNEPHTNVPVIAIDPDRYLLVLIAGRMVVLDLGTWVCRYVDDPAPTLVDMVLFGRRAQVAYLGMVQA